MPNSSPRTVRLLLIDDDKAFTEAADIYARMQEGWTIQVATAPANWSMDGCPPDMVLLDYGLGNGNRDALADWGRRLGEENLLTRTWLLSGTTSMEREEFIKRWGLRGFLRKPIDLNHLPALLATETPSPSSTEKKTEAVFPETPPYRLDCLANELAPAIDIIDLATLEVEWSNHAAQAYPLTPQDRKILRLLEGELWSESPPSPTVAQRLDWDERRNAFRYTRLYPLGERESYWLTRDWHNKAVHDADLFDFEQISSLNDRMNAVAMYLAKLHGITRIRLYKVSELPSRPEYGEDQLSPLVMPLFQRGGGFSPDTDTWLQDAFLVCDNPHTKQAAKQDSQCTLETVAPASGERVGCAAIEFGNAETRAQFPVRNRSDSASPMKALLAFDRRTDHLDDSELANVALRVLGVFDGPLRKEEVTTMRGLLADLGDRLLGWLKDDEQDRERQWHTRISQVLRKALVEQQRTRDADPFDHLSRVCAALMEQWKAAEVAGRVWGLPPAGQKCFPAPRRDPLTGWYLALDMGQAKWQAVAGAGPIVDAYRRHGSPLPIISPHAEAFAGEAWTPRPIQDFPAWREKFNGGGQGSPDAYRFLNSLPNDIGAWLAVPMQLEHGVRALMVVHSPYRYHFSVVRCSLLKDAASRLLPPLAAAMRESQVRGAFTAAVMHEVKNDAAAALLHCELLEKHWGQHPALRDETAAKRLTMLSHYLEGLSELGRDFLDVLRPGSDAPGRDQDDVAFELAQTAVVQPQDWLDNQLRAWRWIYNETPVEVHNGIEGGPITIAAPVLLRRATRVLLQNAFRHGEGQVEISLSLDRDRDRLELGITNSAYATVALGMQAGTDNAIAQIGPAPQARARVGLANATRLAKAVGGSLTARIELEKRGGDVSLDVDDRMHEVRVTLLWPLGSRTPVSSMREV